MHKDTPRGSYPEGIFQHWNLPAVIQWSNGTQSTDFLKRVEYVREGSDFEISMENSDIWESGVKPDTSAKVRLSSVSKNLQNGVTTGEWETFDAFWRCSLNLQGNIKDSTSNSSSDSRHWVINMFVGCDHMVIRLPYRKGFASTGWYPTLSLIFPRQHTSPQKNKQHFEILKVLNRQVYFPSRPLYFSTLQSRFANFWIPRNSFCVWSVRIIPFKMFVAAALQQISSDHQGLLLEVLRRTWGHLSCPLKKPVLAWCILLPRGHEVPAYFNHWFQGGIFIL